MTVVVTHTIESASRTYGLGRTMLYELLGAGKLTAVKAGNRTLIPDESLRTYIASLPAADIRVGQRNAPHQK